MEKIVVIAHLKDTRTGIAKEVFCEHKTEEAAIFMWTNGNYSCDCNRSLFLYDFKREKELGCNSSTDNTIILEKLINMETGKNLLEL